MPEQTYVLPRLPPRANLETVEILKALTKAHRHLGELKGKAASIPNQGILIDTLSLQEAKASSEIENIVTTQDQLFETDLFPNPEFSPEAKEVARYRDALKQGFQSFQQAQGLITNNMLVRMYQLLKRRQDGFRTTSGTALKNEQNGSIVYVPPQDRREIERLMTELENFINADDMSQIDPLVKMAVIHHQFESIHPFPDGNGRIGRILNVLYLTKSGLLDIPILYLSRHITGTKSTYDNLLQAVRDEGRWEDWIIYMLEGISSTSIISLEIIEGIRTLMAEYKNRMRNALPKIYSQDLLNNLFRHPYTRIEYVENDLNVTRQTASGYLEKLTAAGLVEKHQKGRRNYYINVPLVDLLIKASTTSPVADGRA